MSRLLEICPRLSHLQLSKMGNLTKTGRLSMVSLLRQILHNNPSIKVFNMNLFSGRCDIDENIGELVLESLLASRINSIAELNLGGNESWFRHPETSEERSGNIDLLAELIEKQAVLNKIDLGGDKFKSNSTKKILSTIADHPSSNLRLTHLNLSFANFDADESVEKLADIL